MNSGSNPQPPPSPMYPVAPPSKKQRSGNQPPMRDRAGVHGSSSSSKDALSSVADDAIARRRAELRRLQEKRAQQQDARGGLLDQARSQLGRAGPNADFSATSGAPPPVPQRQHHVARARHSDIFPNVAKSETVAAATATAPPSKPTPRVARRLDPAFQERSSRSKSAPPSRPPPPPIPLPLVAEAPPERPSPAPPAPSVPKQPTSTPSMQDETTPTPSTARRDTLRSLRDMAPEQSTEDFELVKELKLAQEEKADALRKVARLKEQIQQLQKPQNQQEPAVTSPPPQQTVSQVGFLSPLNPSATPSHGSRSSTSAFLGSSTRKRMPTPHPKRKQDKNRDGDDEKECFKEAAMSIPFEYTSTLATYIVRRPFSLETADELWMTAGTQSFEAYQATVNSHKASTLEVAAKIAADGSILTLSDVSTVRHQNHATKEWRVFENVDDMDKPLGCVMYIDSDASEKEYWLDAIYEEAFAAREAYCSSLVSAVAALQARRSQPQTSTGTVPQPTVEMPTANTRPAVKNVCVGTDDFNPTADKPTETAAATPPDNAKPAPKELVDENSSGDVLSVFLGIIFSSLVGLVWLVLVRIPFKIFTFSLLLLTTSAFLSVIWLYLADDHGAQSMGAGLQYGFNKPGIV